MYLTYFHFYSSKIHLYSKPVKGLQGYGLSYRFAFNGQEKDDEVSGAGNTMTATFWEYDCRLGRRFNLDPKPNPSTSEYVCFNNNPIFYTDVSGDTSRYYGEDGSLIKTLNDKLPNAVVIVPTANVEALNKINAIAAKKGVENSDKYNAFLRKYYGTTYLTDGFEEFYEETKTKTPASDFKSATIFNDKKQKVTLYSEYNASLVLNSKGEVTIDKKDIHTRSLFGSTDPNALLNKNRIGHIHTHPQYGTFTGYNEKGQVMLKVQKGTSDADNSQGSPKGHYNVMIDATDITFYLNSKTKNITVPRR